MTFKAVLFHCLQAGGCILILSMPGVLGAQPTLTVYPGLFAMPPTGLVTAQPGNYSCSDENGCTWSYPSGAVVTLFAWNTPGTHFQGWTYDQITFASTSLVYTLPPLTANQSIHADYVASAGPYSLMVYKGAAGNGSVTGTGGFVCPAGDISTSQSFASNSVVVLTNQPAAGYSFAYWECEGTAHYGSTLTVTMNGDQLVQPVFVAAPAPPVVSITTPAANTTNWTCQQFYIAASATAQSGVVTNFELFLGSAAGVPLAAQSADVSPANASFRWTTTIPGVTNTFVVRATDNHGLQTVSSPVSITTIMPPLNWLVIGISNSVCALCLSNAAGHVYGLLATTNLPDFAVLDTMPGTNGYSSYLDPAFTNLPCRFYRAGPETDLSRFSDSADTNFTAGTASLVGIVITNGACDGSSIGAGQFHIGFYTSPTPDLAGATLFAEGLVAGCSANGIISTAWYVTLDAPGTYYLGYRINDLNEVPECDSNNNTFFWRVNVQ